jgi:hypothetical protein
MTQFIVFLRLLCISAEKNLKLFLSFFIVHCAVVGLLIYWITISDSKLNFRCLLSLLERLCQGTANLSSVEVIVVVTNENGGGWGR